jgi:hypothetical protein
MIFKKQYLVTLLFIVALFFRLSIAFLYDIKQVYTDAVMYHNYGVNIARGNGFSANVTAPFTTNFIREPGNNYFIGLAYKVSSFFGVPPTFIDPAKDKLPDYMITTVHPEIYWARAFYAVLEAIALVFFFLTLALFFKIRHAFYISLIFALFYPASFFVATLLRESLLTSILIILNFNFAAYLKKEKNIYLVYIGLLLGLSILVFQAMALLGGVICIYLFILYRKKLAVAVKKTAIVGFICVTTIVPWLIRAYNYYPDIRVVKTFGTSLTLEMSGCMAAAFQLNGLGVMDEKALSKYLTGLYQLPSDQQFHFSIDGTFNRQTDSLQKILNDLPANTFQHRTSYKMKQYLIAFKYFLCPSYFSGVINTEKINNANNMRKLFYILPYTFLFLLVFLGLIGVFIYRNDFFPMSLIYIFLFLLILINPFLGSEGRRMLPMFSLWVAGAYFFVIGFIFKKKLTN